VPGQGFITADSGGNSLGSVINLTQSAGVNSTNLGQQPVNGFNLTLDLSKMTTTKASGKGDGLSGPPSPVWNTSMNVYDSLGIKHEMNFKFTRTLVGTGAPANATGRWEWQVSENGVVLTDSTKAGNNALFFDAQGGLIKKNLQQIAITPASGAAPFTITADFSTLTQLANTDSSVTAFSQDGFPVGTLQTFSIGQDGLITGIFANGQSRTLGQIATASFLNPAGLEKLGQNLFRDSNNSGLAQVGLADAQGRGKISTGFVEMSNVDLSNEFTNLIVTQRGFQANTRIVSIVDDLLQDVINLKR
jgi:flagellar hook protein FlgE